LTVKIQQEPVLFLADKVFVDAAIAGGVQLCTHEFINYLEASGHIVKIIKVSPNITFMRKVRKKLQIETYELYDIDQWLDEIVDTITGNQIKLVFFNQVNLAHWSSNIKAKVPADVKFVGLSHGNESGDYLHDITQGPRTSFLKTWRLGKYLVKEKAIFSTYLDGVITISDNETYIDQWLGAQNTFFLPRILKNAFIDWQPVANRIGFAGTLSHLPNYAGIDLLSAELRKRNFNGKLRLVGGPDHIGKKLQQRYSFIEYVGTISSNQLVEEAGTWCILLNPVFWYARGSSTKLAQAISWGIPVASTLAGTRGYDLASDAIAIKNNDPAELADMIINTLASSSALDELKQRVMDNAIRFDLAAWSAKLSDFLAQLKQR